MLDKSPVMCYNNYSKGNEVIKMKIEKMIMINLIPTPSVVVGVTKSTVMKKA